MRHDFIDKYGNLDSLLHRIDPRIKLSLAFAFLILTAITENPTLFTVYFGIILVLVLISKVPVGFFLKKCLVVTPLAVVLSFFIVISYIIENDIRITIELFGWNSPISPVYITLGLLIFKIYTSILVLSLLIASTRFNDLLWGLRKLHLPEIVTTLSRLVYTYIFVLIDELHRIQRAYKSRTPELRISRIKLYGNIAGGIFLRSMERSDSIYKAMVSRGFTGDFPEGNANRLKWIDLTAVLFFFLVVITVRMVLWNI